MACAFASVLVTLALLAETGMLTVRAPAVVVTGTVSSQVVTLAVWKTMTLPLAVRAPELSGALSITACSKVSMSTAAFVGPDTHFIFFTSKVTFTERGWAFVS